MHSFILKNRKQRVPDVHTIAKWNDPFHGFLPGAVFSTNVPWGTATEISWKLAVQRRTSNVVQARTIQSQTSLRYVGPDGVEKLHMTGFQRCLRQQATLHPFFILCVHKGGHLLCSFRGGELAYLEIGIALSSISSIVTYSRRVHQFQFRPSQADGNLPAEANQPQHVNSWPTTPAIMATTRVTPLQAACECSTTMATTMTRRRAALR
ncbi:hypothetical protein EDB87DRAFT_712552 [Lactarius vividus]|nr:hypothetical protein EDB87DRAFT_712552 [Lactarius vividus]